MLILALSLGLTAVLFAKAEYRRLSDVPALGTMSQDWLAVYNASRPTSSQ